MKSLLLVATALIVPAVAFGQMATGIAVPLCGGPGLPVCASNAWSADLTNALTGVAILVLPVVGGMLVQALRKLATKWDLEGTAQNTANLESDIHTALNAGITQVLPTIEQTGWDSAQTRAAALAAAADYLAQRFPDRTKEIVAAAQPAGAPLGPIASADAIKQTLAARLPDAMATAAASPATPPAPLDPIGAPVVKV